MGPMAVAATGQSDLPVVMGVVMYTVAVVIVVNLLVDTAQRLAQPEGACVMTESVETAA